jgi:hypothetical protein
MDRRELADVLSRHARLARTTGGRALIRGWAFDVSRLMSVDDARDCAARLLLDLIAKVPAEY